MSLKAIFKGISYGVYMVGLRLKAIPYLFIKKTKGEEVADKFVKKIAYNWAKFTIDTIGIELDIIGQENIPKESFLVVGNHNSILDIPIIVVATDRQIGFIAKKELLKTPVLGYWMENGHCLPLDRENPREAIKVITAGAEKIKKGYCMAIFPEGTRSKDGVVAEFKKGSLKLATKAKAPILPISIERADRAYELNRKFQPMKIKVVIDKPIYTKDISKEDEKVLHEKVRDIVIKNLPK